MTKFYGLTGGIGAGKSTVASMFADMGVPVLDLDKVGKNLLHDEGIKLQLRQAFGQSIFDHDGNIDTQALRDHAFASTQSTQTLNSIMHPAIYQKEQVWREQQTAPFAIIEASVLLESGAVKRMDGIIVVLADMDTRKQRVLHRGMQDEAAFDAIVQRQCDDHARYQAADFILTNNGSKVDLKHAVQTLYQQLGHHP